MSDQPKASQSDSQTIVFMVLLSVICAVILAVMASALSEPILQAKELDRSKEMMIASRILNHQGHFLMSESGQTVLAHYAKDGKLVPGDHAKVASNAEILDLYNKRLMPLLVNDKGELTTFKAAGINQNDYFADYKKSGYYKQPLKLIYKLLPNNFEGSFSPDLKSAEAWVIPINGMGLWDAIYGYLAIATDGVTVIGISWYDQKETPGLGANIVDENWQILFPGKKIFLESPSGEVDVKTAPLGLVVVKGKVSEVYVSFLQNSTSKKICITNP